MGRLIRMHPFEKKTNPFKRFISYLGIIIPLTLVIAGALWHFMGPRIAIDNSFLSPIPNFLQLTQNNQVKLLDFWSPVVQQIHGSEGDLPSMTAQSILMYDLTSDKIIYQRDPKTRHAMASLTKIMTAIIALENPKSDDRYIVNPEAIVGEDSMGLTAGEVLSREELLYGLMLPSGNDAAEVLAHNFPTGRIGFLQAMNNKAKALGLVDTHFSNPSGLQGDGVQYTTASDLLVLTRYALEQYPLFKKIVSTKNYVIPQTATHKEFDLANETNLLETYPGVRGVKTGYTPEAGLCLVTYLNYSGHEIVGVILNSENRRGEMKELLDYSLKTLHITPPPYDENAL